MKSGRIAIARASVSSRKPEPSMPVAERTRISFTLLLGVAAGILDDFGPPRRLFPDESADLVGRGREDEHALPLELLLHVGRGEAAHRLGVQARDDLAR